MIKLCQKGVDKSEAYLVENSIEKKIKEFKNENVEVDERTSNNRLMLLLEDKFHGDVLAKCLQENQETAKEALFKNFGVTELL